MAPSRGGVPGGGRAPKRGGLSQARTYHPRGRTVRERPKPVVEPAPEPEPTREPTGGSKRRTPPRSSPRTPSGTARKGANRGTDRGTDRAADRGTGRGGGKATPRRPAGAGRGPDRPRQLPALASPRRRLRLATVLALALFAALGIRLVELQLTDGPAYAASGLANRLQEVELPAARGAIYDRNGAVLAHSVEARLVFADPELVTDPERAAAALQPLLGIPASELAARMAPEGPSNYEWLARGVELAVADEIMALNLAGIGVHRDERRIVPGNDLAANVIGFTGTDLAGLEGLEGLEAYFDDLLRGVDGQRIYEGGHGATRGLGIPGGYRVETAPQPGSDLHLTLEMDVQFEVQRVLAERLRAASASFGAAVLLDARTGDVLALASYPTYNAADPLSAPATERVDAATTLVFDPGSAHKPIVFAAALEEGVISPGDSLVVDPTIRLGDQTFEDSIWHAAGTRMSLAAIMAFSSNVGTIMIAEELGSQALYEYQQAFGLGAATGVGMPGEAAGALLAPEDWSGSSYGSVPIGHSVDVTVLQLAAVYGAIANGGVWVQPRLVGAVVGPDGTEVPSAATADPQTRRVMAADNASYLRELMEAVVTVPNATGLGAAVDGYRVAGKTGTGALVRDGEYVDGSVSTFVGMAPADNPRYVLAVSAHGAGGDVVTGAFQEMMGFALQHNRVPPAVTGPPAFDLFP